MKASGLLLGATLPIAVALGSLVRPAPAAVSGDAVLQLPEQLRVTPVISTRGMVVSGCLEASRAGAAMLAAGGNAVDAAVAAALALGVAEPGQSGLGGQTYMLICLRDGRRVAIDGSCVAPMRVSRPVLQRMAAEGRLFGHKLVAAPATLAALAYALERFGTMALARVIAPAIEIADAGIRFTPNQRHFLNSYIDKVREHSYLANLFLKDGLFVWDLDRVYCQPDQAPTLRRIAAGGQEVFYRGAIASEIEADMVANGGWVRRDDLARVRPVEREPVAACYRDFEVVSFPPPGGGTAVVETLRLLDRFPPENVRRPGLDAVQLVLEATRLALADESALRQPTPAAIQRLLSDEHSAARAARILPDRALTREELGEGDDPPWFDRETTQLSVADRFGNVVSLTQTLSQGFGACVATPGLGFPYNCMLATFDFERSDSRVFLLPLKTPYTTMAPTIVLREGRPYLVLGGVGSARITSSLVLTLVNVIDGGMTLAEAVGAPRVLWAGNAANTIYAEVAGPITDELVEGLRRRGYDGVVSRHFPLDTGELGWQGCVNAIAIDADGTLIGVGDPRRQGVAVAPD